MCCEQGKEAAGDAKSAAGDAAGKAKFAGGDITGSAKDAAGPLPPSVNLGQAFKTARGSRC